MDKPKRNNGWWDIEEKQPRKDGTRCLVMTSNGVVVEAQWDAHLPGQEGSFDHWECWRIPFDVTHWRPMIRLPRPSTDSDA